MTLLTRIRRRAAREIVPWGPGYARRRQEELERRLRDSVTLAAFRDGSLLPAGYGVGLDERCVELPWLVALLGDDAGAMLDAGSALNHAVVLDAILPRVRRLDIVTLAPEPECHWRRGVSYLFCDLRDLPLRGGLYDTVACVSTLEHVGFDNTAFSRDPAHAERRREDFLRAVRELRRVMLVGGRLLLTVPFGRQTEFRGFQQFDAGLLGRAIEAFGSSTVEIRYFRYAGTGWQVADQAAAADAEYVDWVATAWSTGRMPQPLPLEPDRAAAARAVACAALVAE